MFHGLKEQISTSLINNLFIDQQMLVIHNSRVLIQTFFHNFVNQNNLSHHPVYTGTVSWFNTCI